MDSLNLDLVSVGITAAGIGLLGFIAFFNNPKSITNKSFLAFSLITIVWSLANYFQYQPSSPMIGLWIVRIIAFFGCWHAFTFFQLCYVFPEQEVSFSRLYRYGLIPIVGIISLCTLSPLVFNSVTATSPYGVVTKIQNGPAIALFGIISLLLIGGGIALLTRKAIRRSGNDRSQVLLMSTGTLLTFLCILVFNLVLPAFFDNAGFLPFSAFFIFPLIACTAYAIFRYGLFKIKIIASQTLAFLLSIATLLQVAYSSSAVELLFRLSIFTLVLSFSILMVRSVMKEVQQRDIITAQAAELEVISKRQENLLHFISHEIKGYLAKNEAGFAAIVEGDFGAIPDPLKHMAELALSDTRKGVNTVIDILDAANLKKGTVSFTKEHFDFADAVASSVEGLTASAHEKGLQLRFAKPASGTCMVIADEPKMKSHVIRNLIDNSIRYTPTGGITVQVEKDDSLIRFTVTDTGVGITPEDMQRLFTEGGHGKDSIKVNVHSTGFGLFIAKQVVVAHGGKIWAESEGAGKGSRFIVELPAA